MRPITRMRRALFGRGPNLPQGVREKHVMELVKNIRPGAVLRPEHAELLRKLSSKEGGEYRDTGKPADPVKEKPADPWTHTGTWYVQRYPGLTTWHRTGRDGKTGEMMIQLGGKHYGNITSNGTAGKGGLREVEVIPYEVNASYRLDGRRIPPKEVEGMDREAKKADAERRKRALEEERRKEEEAVKNATKKPGAGL